VVNAPASALNASAQGPDEAFEPDGRGAGLGRVLLVAGVLLAAALIVHLTPIRSHLDNVHHRRETVEALGVWVCPLTVVIVAVLVACGVPRLATHVAGGVIFGFAGGFVLTMLGAVLGHYGLFLFIRWGGQQWVLNRWPALRKWADAVHDQGTIGVLLIRQLPAHAMLINAGLALSHVRHRDFLAGTALGLLPEAIPATLIGAGLMRPTLKHSTAYFTLAAAAFALIWVGGGYAFRALRKHRQARLAV
jgi:uncharacterized membrane protein YdjX (TVP38/TMEM64 family)